MRRRSGYEPTNRADGNLPVEHEDQPDTAAASHAGTRCGKPDRKRPAGTNRTHRGTDKTEGTEEYHPPEPTALPGSAGDAGRKSSKSGHQNNGANHGKDMERSETGIFSAAESQAKGNAAPGEAAAATGETKETGQAVEKRRGRERGGKTPEGIGGRRAQAGRARSAGREEPEALGENRTRTQKI